MSHKYVGVFDASLIYHELAIYIGFPDINPTLQHRLAIAYLIDKECLVEYSESVTDWYRPNVLLLHRYNIQGARRVFHDCFNYFLLGAMNFENIHLQFIGHNVFVSNFPFDLKSLNRPTHTHVR